MITACGGLKEFLGKYRRRYEREHASVNGVYDQNEIFIWYNM